MSLPTIVTENVYQIDTLVQLNVTFYQSDGVTPVDPTTVLAFVQDPSGAVTPYTTPTIVRQSTGVYTLQLTPSMSGQWVYKWQGTGAVEITSADVYFTVAASAVIAG